MRAQYRTWQGAQLGRKCAESLKKHGFDAHFCDSAGQARDFILEMTAAYETFGFGGSDTTRSLGLLEALENKGKTIFDHLQEGLDLENQIKTRKSQAAVDCFLCSANGISLTGEIVNVDGIGNRTSAMTFGPGKVIIVAGTNKIAPDLYAAMDRVQQTAGPMRAKSLGMATPCAETGICNDCSSPQRICNITLILHRRPWMTDISVVLVNEDLGF